ncbi:hypothetical protein GPECTOR_38g296 [Gonium pectorale]|uniref:Oxidation resistance protein 1 n=1 Tax=Gonium pectorale TaxID=33097 RepID=A0A150GB54_GONPE|nr:hypothetical protein GPECTOR_38g296 [Gonium pectorale]|eukprot:KXZ47059.1 hypothetical protein GPECTOR_38g296 [Gonium pectorale]
MLQRTFQVPGSLVVTSEYVDFVEVKARVRQEEFVGISTVKADVQTKKRGGMGLFMCCVAPAEGAEPADLGATGAAGCKDEAEERGGQDGTSTSGGGRGVWQMLWSKNGVPQRQAFEASVSTREALHRHTQRWLGQLDEVPGEATVAESGELQLAVPRNLTVGEGTLQMLGEPSVILSGNQASALASAVPPLERMKSWTLSYSTTKHGISLATLYRKAVNGVPSILLVRDFGGETFVFQLEPYRVAYPWRSLSQVKNDFFQYGTPECLAVGGLGHFAIWLDAELLHGSSGTCGTFGSPCLAHNEEFKIQYVEVWQALQ